MFKLLKHFTVMSALATAAIATVLVFGYRWYENRNLSQLAEDRNVAQAYSFANAIVQQYQSHFDQAGQATGDDLRSLPLTRQLDVDLRQLTRNLPVLKVKIYNPAGLTVYSSSLSQIGENKGSDPMFAASVSQQRPMSAISFRDVLNSFGETFKGRYVAETYVPIRNEYGGVQFVVELYTDITVYVAEVNREMMTVLTLLVSAMGALFVFLLLIVKRADGILVKQYGELETFSSRLEEKVEERTKRLMNQQSLLSWVTKSEEFRHDKLDVSVRTLTRVAATALAVDRASIWMFTAERDALKCMDLYCASRGDHSSGPMIRVAEHPVYFDALTSEEVIVSNDVRNDPRLAGFVENYLKVLNVGSMLDVPIVHAGRVEGVLCIEHVGEPMAWTAEQRLFATAVANFASLALERQERSKAEVELREANRSVEAATKAKSLFLANMSHEIRTPMNGVFGMTDLLMKTELNDRQRKFVGIISGSAKRLLTIINDILDLSRIESGKFELDSHAFSLRECTEETIDLLAGEAQRKGLDLNVFVAGDVPAMVVGDSGRVRQVLTNIVSNAVKFTSSGEVTVRIGCLKVEDGKSELRFEVRDTGIGISEEMQRQLFMPFQQADTSISRRFGGTGLGLSISRHLIELMGGEIALESKLGDGSCISFVLSLAVVAGQELATKPSASRLSGAKVLVVDDRETNRDVLSAYLTEGGARVTAEPSALEGYATMCRAREAGEPFALVLVDMMMPDANGLEFAQMVRGNPGLADVRLVMVTSLNWKGDVRLARELGFRAFLTKPVHRDELMRTVGRCLSTEMPSVGDVMDIPTAVQLPEVAAGLSVLVAEDNPVNVEVAREYLAAMGCKVTCAENGRLAVEAVKREMFDIVLMDCQMPEMDGLTATQIIRAFENESGRRATAIIAVTANAFAEDRAKCVEAGMDDYVSKPFSEAQLRQLILRWAPAAKPVAKVVADVAKADATGVATTLSSAPMPVPAPAAAVTVVVPMPEGGVETAGAIDMDMLLRMQKTHPTLVGRLVDTYLNYGPKAVQQMVAALEAENHGQLMMTAHSLKSSSANIGAMKLSAICKDLEHRLKSTSEWDGEKNLTAVCEVETAFFAVHGALTQLQSEIKAAAPLKAVVA